MTFYQDEVDRHIAWIRVENGATPQRSTNEDSGSAEAVFLVHGQMLSILAGDDEGDANQGTWFWLKDDDRVDEEFTVPYGGDPTPEQRARVEEFVSAMGTNLPFRLKEESRW